MTKPGIYRHKKGNRYRVLGTATVATNGEHNGKKVIIYEPFPRIVGKEETFVRDETEFEEPGRFTYEFSLPPPYEDEL